MTTTNLPSGTYKISSGWIWNHSATNTDMLANITLNGTPLGTTSTINIEISDKTTWQTAARFFYATLLLICAIPLAYMYNQNNLINTFAFVILINKYFNINIVNLINTSCFSFAIFFFSIGLLIAATAMASLNKKFFTKKLLD